MPTIESSMRAMRREFEAAGIDSAATDARRLTMAATGLSPSDLATAEDRSVEEGVQLKLGMMARRRLRREPVSRILGRRSFWSLRIEVGEAVLDPRPETECLVEQALAVLPSTGRPWIADLGSGSGCILISILTEHRGAFGVATDISIEALRQASRNVARFGLHERCAFICADWLCGLSGSFDVIVANPPYVRTGEIAGLEPEVRLHDPRVALDGGVDGLGPLRRICAEAPSRLAVGGWLLIEIAPGARAVADELMARAGLRDRRVIADLAGRPRVAVGRKGPSSAPKKTKALQVAAQTP